MPAVISASHDAFDRMFMERNLACLFNMAIGFRIGGLSLPELLFVEPPNFARNHFLDQRGQIFIQPFFKHGPH